MFAQVTTFRIHSAAITKVVRAFERQILPEARTQPGFLKADLLTRSRLNKGVAVFYWDTEGDAMNCQKSGTWSKLLAPLDPFVLEPPTTEGYEPNIVSPFPDGTRT
ncbi:MAG: antibiotic biosynthesis monooxygenase family protein [Gaiellaceae bacterium]